MWGMSVDEIKISWWKTLNNRVIAVPLGMWYCQRFQYEKYNFYGYRQLRVSIHLVYKQFILLNIKKINNSIKIWAEDLNKHFSTGDINMANSHMERCSISLIIREIWIKTSLHTCYNGYHQEVYKWPMLASVEKREPIYTIGGNVN